MLLKSLHDSLEAQYELASLQPYNKHEHIPIWAHDLVHRTQAPSSCILSSFRQSIQSTFLMSGQQDTDFVWPLRTKHSWPTRSPELLHLDSDLAHALLYLCSMFLEGQDVDESYRTWLLMVDSAHSLAGAVACASSAPG